MANKLQDTLQEVNAIQASINVRLLNAAITGKISPNILFELKQKYEDIYEQLEKAASS